MNLKATIKLVAPQATKSVRIKAGNGVALLVGERSQTFVSANCPAGGDGDLLISSLLLKRIGATLGPGAELAIVGNVVKIKDGVAYTLEGSPNTEFPEAPEVEGPTLAGVRLPFLNCVGSWRERLMALALEAGYQC